MLQFICKLTMATTLFVPRILRYNRQMYLDTSINGAQGESPHDLHTFDC